jgi:hypothetical protein
MHEQELEKIYIYHMYINGKYIVNVLIYLFENMLICMRKQPPTGPGCRESDTAISKPSDHGWQSSSNEIRGMYG